MSKSSNEEAMLGAIGFTAVAVFVGAAILSGLLPLALLSGVLVFTVVLACTRELLPASWAGGGVAVLITMIGVLNVLSPGWHQSLL